MIDKTITPKIPIKRTPTSKKFATEVEQRLALINRADSRRLKLILHVGTPKTGTTSVQVYLDKKQRKLRLKGILYPNRFHNPNAPKHQWFERNLVSANAESFVDNFSDIINHVEEHTHTILLSSEGIYNHWWDFPQESKALLYELNTLFDVEIWAWFRDPLVFAESFYKQCLRNPQVDHISCYGKDLSFAEMLDDPWFSQHLDYIGFVNECDELFGKNSVSVFDCQTDTVKTLIDRLGLTTPHDNPTPRKNNCMNTVTAELYRVINRLPLAAKEKEKLVPFVNELDAVLIPYCRRENDSLIDSKSREKIINMTAEGMLEIQKRFVV
jgi:hypothetical protein